MDFQQRLIELNISPIYYLRKAKSLAKLNGLNYKTLDFSNAKNKKLSILDDQNKKVNFGSAVNNDFIIWTILEKRKDVPKDYAKMKQNVFWQSHTKMNYDKEDKYSANNLSLFILW